MAATLKIEKLLISKNIAADLNKADPSGQTVTNIGLECKRGFDDDKTSRSQWEDWASRALELALQVLKTKTFPWPACSNVRFPLLTIAALAWHAKAYPALIPGDNVVKYEVLGKDPDNIKAQRAERKGKYMSYKLLKTTTWEEQTDKGLLCLSILGTTFKKTVRDNNEKKNCSDLVMPQDLVVNYWTKDMETCPRASHMFTMTKNEVRENVLQDLFLDEVLKLTTPLSVGPLEASKDKSQHLQPSEDSTVFHLVEQSCFLDLDGDDYAEPYAVTFERETGKVVRILARYYKSDIKKTAKGDIYRIEPENYYTKFELIPSPDGGFYGLGFGLLLGPINESVNSAFNQIFDGGTMMTLGGGFLGRGARIKAGQQTIKPYEWITVDSTGDDLRKNIVPHQFREPSMILLELIKFLVNYGERVAGAGDIQMGELPGQNLKAGTAEIANENGRQIFDATWKRFWRSEKEEFRKLDKLEGIFLKETEGFSLGGNYYEVAPEDFREGSDGVCPVADPNITSKTEKRFMADMALADALHLGGNVYEATKRKYDAYGYSGFEQVFPDPKGPNAIPPPPNIEMMKLQIQAQDSETKATQAQAQAGAAQATVLIKAQEAMANIRLLEAQAVKLHAEVLMMSDDSSHEEVYKQVAMLNTQIAAEKLAHDRLMGVAEVMLQGEKLRIEEKKVDKPAPAKAA